MSAPDCRAPIGRSAIRYQQSGASINRRADNWPTQLLDATAL
jgi:hypothetical protein